MSKNETKSPPTRSGAITRRQLLAGAAGLGAAGMFRGWPILADAATALPAPGAPKGKFLGTLPFASSNQPVFGETTGVGLAGRRLFDISTLSTENMITGNDQFFIRTRTPENLPEDKDWQVRVRLADVGPTRVPLSWFHERERDLGVHLIEGTTNARRNGFGAISAARWTGVPITDLLEGIPDDPALFGLLISGYDRHALGQDAGSQAGASWTFTIDQLRSTGAFLATQMNGKRLTSDQGGPIRLVVPGWFGCTCIKWVQDIIAQGWDGAASRHMREYSRATFQRGKPRLAQFFQPAVITFSAVPIRIEEWEVGGKRMHRIVGIAWGDGKGIERMLVRVVPEANPNRKGGITPKPVEYFTAPAGNWTLWSHTVEVPDTGRHRIGLVVEQRGGAARRLTRGHFTRRFVIPEA